MSKPQYGYITDEQSAKVWRALDFKSDMSHAQLGWMYDRCADLLNMPVDTAPVERGMMYRAYGGPIMIHEKHTISGTINENNFAVTFPLPRDYQSSSGDASRCSACGGKKDSTGWCANYCADDS